MCPNNKNKTLNKQNAKSVILNFLLFSIFEEQLIIWTSLYSIFYAAGLNTAPHFMHITKKIASKSDRIGGNFCIQWHIRCIISNLHENNLGVFHTQKRELILMQNWERSQTRQECDYRHCYTTYTVNIHEII